LLLNGFTTHCHCHYTLPLPLHIATATFLKFFIYINQFFGNLAQFRSKFDVFTTYNARHDLQNTIFPLPPYATATPHCHCNIATATAARSLLRTLYTTSIKNILFPAQSRSILLRFRRFHHSKCSEFSQKSETATATRCHCHPTLPQPHWHCRTRCSSTLPAAPTIPFWPRPSASRTFWRGASRTLRSRSTWSSRGGGGRGSRGSAKWVLAG
jgi:hypothetical protein